MSSRLQKIFQRDKYTGSHGSYRVSSLYFDTPYDKALRQKLNGVSSREKFRLRYYGEDTSRIRLEKKWKINGLCGKYGAWLTEDEVRRILCGDSELLLQKESPVLLEFYSKLRGQLLSPTTIVAYDREAFLYEPGNVRITIDRNVRTRIGSKAFLNPRLEFTDISENQAILEVKYDAFLPEVAQRMVQLPGCRLVSFSKYAICRKYD